MSFLLSEPLLLFVTVVVLLCASAALGYWLATATHINDSSDKHEQLAGLRDGLFVLLGLLLSFTIAMVIPRFDQREEMVVREANAIRATMMRAQMLPEPERGKILELVHEYMKVRYSFGNAGRLTPAALNQNIEQTQVLQEELWQEVVTVTQDNQSAVVAAFAASLSNMIDIAAQRLALLEQRVPKEVWIVIILVGAFQSFVAGYNLKQKFWLLLVIAPVVVASVMTLIVDLDCPRKGLIRIQQDSMERLISNVSGSHQ